MNRILILLSALLLLSGGVAFATGIPQAFDPKNEAMVWTEDVYNASSSAIGSGYIVQWYHDGSDVSVAADDDRCPYVIIADAVADVWTAGVAIRSIPAYTTGQIVIKGPIGVFMGRGSSVGANTLVGTDAEGLVTDFIGTGADTCTLGVAITATTSSTWGAPIIYVDPVRFSDN